MQAVILAGGLGTRLRPVTHKVPKPMVEVNGKPFLEYLILLLKKNGIDDIVLLIGHLGEQIKGYFGDGSKFGVNIKYSVEEELLGTGGAIKNAESLLNDVFLVLNGDTYLDTDYSALISSFKGSLGVVVVYKSEDKEVNNIRLNKNLVAEYKKGSPLDFADAGVQIFKKDILKLMPAGKVSLETEIYPKLIKQKQLRAFVTENKFYDIGTFKRLEIFKKELK